MADYVYSSGSGCHGLARDALMERCRRARRYLRKNQEKRERRRELATMAAVTVFLGLVFLFGLGCGTALAAL